MIKVKAYIGVIGSGKSYQSKKECDTTISFADSLREAVWRYFGWKPINDEEYSSFKEKKDVFFKGEFTTGRELFQIYGSYVRSKDINYWVKRLVNKLDELKKLDDVWNNSNVFSVGVDDCRYENEIHGLIDWCAENKVELTFIHSDYLSGNYNKTMKHESERLAQRYAGNHYACFDDMIKGTYTLI